MNAPFAIRTGEVEDVLVTLEPNSLSACLTDPPYGLRFMNAAWDYDVPSVHVWRALWRAMKPGAPLLSFGSSRTGHRIACGIEDAGFELRDTIMWMYGTGFPKSQNAKKATNRDDLDGYGTALKPAFEPIVLARKPLDGTMAQNIERHGCGPLAIDASRIATDWSERSEAWKRSGHSAKPEAEKIAAPPGNGIDCNPLGRWPANVILDEAAGAVLDAQTGELSTHGGRVTKKHAAMGFAGGNGSEREVYASTGGAARFFYCAKASTAEREAGLDGMPVVAGHDLVGRGEDTAGLESPRAGAGRKSRGRSNTHPTVKPIALAEYLARLVLPPGGEGRILVPYSGVGSEMIGALRAGWTDIVGIERDPEYVRIAEARLAHWIEKAKVAA